MMTKTADLDSVESNNLKKTLLRCTGTLVPFPFFVLFKERKFNMKPIQIVTLLSEIFYLLSDSFILKLIEKGGKK